MKNDRRTTLLLALLAVSLFAPCLASATEVQPAPTTRADRPDPDGLDDFVASLEGAWIGVDEITPVGPLGMAMLLEWNDRGELHSRSALDRETYIDIRFEKTDAGRWLLHEEAAMEGLGVQAYTLVAAGRTEGGGYRWILEARPEFLSIEIERVDETMHFDVSLRGEPHVAFRLARRPDAERAALREQLAVQADRSPQEGASARGAAASPAPQEPVAMDERIAQSRTAVTADPQSATARLTLAQTLGAAIDGEPGLGPRHAFEMLEALQTAIALDPTFGEAYQWLAGYYLNAPPIAGGSVESARELAEELARYDPEGAERIRTLVAQHSAGTSRP